MLKHWFERKMTNEFKWTDEQREALDAIQRWKKGFEEDRAYHDDDDFESEYGVGGYEQIFRLFGFAGTGKTTVIKEIARQSNGSVVFVAFTGKAASVMQKNGCVGAQTIHSLIYKPLSELAEEAKKLRTWIEDYSKLPIPEIVAEAERNAIHQWGTADPRKLQERLTALRDRIEEGPQWILRDKLDPKPSVIICDEVSMVNEELARDLMSFGIPIIAIGDPGQLPPVKGQGFFIDAEPDAMLREVHRFALENPITRIATTVRLDGAYKLRLGDYGESRYLRRAITDSTDMLVEADQVLCGMHKTRKAVNAAIREAYGYSGDIPLPGEKVICGRNSKLHRLLNGTLWRIKSCHPKDGYLKAVIEPWDEDGAERKITMHPEPFAGREILPEDRFDAEEFDFGYCLTTHKAQGSQWPYVCVVNDGFGTWGGGDLHNQWMYTAVTRAEKRLTIIKPDVSRNRESRREGGRLLLRDRV